jgi:hypothetical protein
LCRSIGNALSKADGGILRDVRARHIVRVRDAHVRDCAVVRDCFQRPGRHIIPTGLREALRFLWAELGLQKMQPQCGGHAEREAVLNPLLFLPAFLVLGPTPGHARRPAHVRGGTDGRGRGHAARRRLPGRVALVTGPFQALGEGRRLEPLRVRSMFLL